LFESPHFKALIKKIKNDFEYLVNPIFDLEEIMKPGSIPTEVEKKYTQKNITRQLS